MKSTGKSRSPVPFFFVVFCLLAAGLIFFLRPAMAQNGAPQKPCPCYRWIDVKTGKTVNTWPWNAEPPMPGDPDRAFSPKTGQNFARLCGTIWIDVKTGKKINTWPWNAEPPMPGDPDHAFSPKTGQNFARVPCPPPANGGKQPKGKKLQGQPAAAAILNPPEWVSLQFQGVDVNRVRVIIHNKTGEERTFVIPAGLVFIPDDPLYQKMMSVHTARIVVAPNGSEKMEIRAMCLEMKKDEPNLLVKFTPADQTDPVLQRLADLTSRAGFAGPHDQARIWIYTDQADLDTLNKRVIPTLSAGEYLQALYEVSQKAGVDLTTPPYRKLLDPKLSSAPDASSESKQWLTETFDAMTKK